MTPFLQSAMPFGGEIVLRVTVLLAVTALAAAAGRRASASLRHLIWILGLGAALLLPMLTLLLPNWNLVLLAVAPVRPSARMSAGPSAVASASLREGGVTAPDSAPETSGLPQASQSSRPAALSNTPPRSAPSVAIDALSAIPATGDASAHDNAMTAVPATGDTMTSVSAAASVGAVDHPEIRK